jgi:HEAT repeat protein
MGDEAIPNLAKALHDESSTIRETAAVVLNAKGIRGLPALLDGFRSGSPPVRLSAVRGMSGIEDRRAIQTLGVALKTDEIPLIRQEAVQALGKTGTQEVIAPLIEGLDDHELSVVKKVRDILKQLRDVAMPELEVLLKTGRMPERLLAARALQSMADPDTIPALIEAISDREREVRQAVIQALAAIGEEAVDPLIAIANDEKDKRRVSAVFALNEIGDSRAKPVLLKGLADKNSATLRHACAFGLGELGAFDAVVPLTRALNDIDKDVQRAAAAALKKIDTAESRRAYEQWKRRHA